MRLWLQFMLTLCVLSAHCQTVLRTAVVPQASAGAVLTLDQVISLAQANEPAFAAAVAESHATALERTIARTALLPSVTYHNQALYTQPNGARASRIGQTAGADSPLFIANNAVREYASQGVVAETIGLNQVAAVRVATAAALRAEAEAEIVRRGLVLTVTGLFYGAQGASSKVTVATEALDEAKHFLEITQAREAAREAAHADVLKAQLQEQQRERELADATLQGNRARLELGVLLYPDPTTPFQLEAAALPTQLPGKTDVESLAKQNNPELRSASATLQAAKADTFSSKAALTPDLALNFTYGIDATNFGVNGPDGIRNLGYSMGATLDVPVWDWLGNERRIKASKLRENAAGVVLSAAQRRLLADLEEFYAEAEVAAQQLRSLDGSVTTARESLRLTNLRYVDGEGTALEVVDAQNAVLTAELADIDGQLRYQVSRAQLQTLTGRLP